MQSKFFLTNLNNNHFEKKHKREYSNSKKTRDTFFLASIDGNKRTKATFVCPQNYKEEITNTRAQITVSLGKDLHEGTKLISTLGLVDSNFSSCIIMLDDTIQWYTNYILRPDVSPRILMEEAHEAGSAWISKNKHIFEMLSIPYEIIRWEDVLLRDEFELLRLQVTAAYYQNPDYKKSIDENIADFLGRIENHHQIDKERAFVLCLNYLLEECSGMISWAKRHNCEFEVYPSGRNQSMAATYELFIRPRYPNLLKPIGIRFSKKEVDPFYCQKLIDEAHSTEHFQELNKRM